MSSRNATVAGHKTDSPEFSAMLDEYDGADEVIRSVILAQGPEGDFTAAQNNLMEEGIPLPRPLYERLRAELFGGGTAAGPLGEAAGSAAAATATTTAPPAAAPTPPTPTAPAPAKKLSQAELSRMTRAQLAAFRADAIRQLGPGATYTQARDALAQRGDRLVWPTFRRIKAQVFADSGDAAAKTASRPHRPPEEDAMFGLLAALRAAIARLTGSLNALADTADTINAGVRSQLALDGPAGRTIDAPALPAVATMPGGLSGLPQDATAEEAAPAVVSASRNGRRKPAHAGTA